MQKLMMLQSLWTFEDLDTPPCAPMLAARLDLIKGAGFAGAGTLWLSRDMAREASALAAERGLILEGLALPDTIDALQPALDWGTEFRLHHLNIQPNVRTGELRKGVALLEGWQRLAEQVDFPVHIETHRGRLTNDLFFTLQLLEACPWVKLTADLSHYVVGGEIVLPVDTLHDSAITNVLDHAAAFHGRIATSEQVQAEIGFAQHRPWVEQFSTWWLRGFRAWRDRAAEDAELTFLCELGPRPYAATDVSNRDLSDRWADSLALKALAERLWQMTGTQA
jgi:hypothetical protein